MVAPEVKEMLVTSHCGRCPSTKRPGTSVYHRLFNVGINHRALFFKWVGEGGVGDMMIPQ